MSKDEEGYNGWPNRETWAVALLLGNTEGWYHKVQNATKLARDINDAGPEFWLGSRIRNWVEAMFENVYHEPEAATKDERMMACDVGSLWRVDWAYYARNLLEEE